MTMDAPDVGGAGYQSPDTDAPANDLAGPDFTAMCTEAMAAGEAAGQKRGSGVDSLIPITLPPVPFERP